MERRKHPRMESANLLIDVTDGQGLFSGSINNLSRFGLCLNNLSFTLDQNAKRLSIVVSGHGRKFKMLATPRWIIEGGYKKNIGVEIVNAPWGWTEFVMSLEPNIQGRWLDKSRN